MQNLFMNKKKIVLFLVLIINLLYNILSRLMILEKQKFISYWVIEKSDYQQLYKFEYNIQQK